MLNHKNRPKTAKNRPKNEEKKRIARRAERHKPPHPQKNTLAVVASEQKIVF
jgi:hypothetical protein